MSTGICKIVGNAIICLLCATTTFAVEYKEYKHSRRQKEYFEITFDKREVKVTVYHDGDYDVRTFPRSSIEITEDQVVAGGEVLFDREGLLFGDHLWSYDEISDARILDSDDQITIIFLTREPSSSKTSRFKRGNLISFRKPLTVQEDEFVRGLTLSIAGDIEVYGEVNKDVISLFGDIYIGPDAVARGDVTSMTGRIDVARDASVYGEIFSVKKKGLRRRHRFYRRPRTFSIEGDLVYNRVDGLTLFADGGFKDPDSLLPTFRAAGGYAFESKRWRYSFSLEQTILRSPSVSVGGSFYRRLASDDDWLLDDDENSAFALVVREDFKDYYEAEGGTAYLNFKPLRCVTLETRYRYEETKWLDAHRHLWSLFGGDKLFDENFQRVESSFRRHGMEEIDTTTNAYWYNRIDWDTRIQDEPFDRSAWHLTADIEWAHQDLESDFDYRRYTTTFRRYQRVSRRAMLLLRGMFGGSDGYLPMYKRFYLGGLGTLRGYHHKEFMGTRFWMANAEYRVDFPRTETAVSVLWDAARIANDSKLDSSIDIKHDVGVALYLGDDFRMSLTKRLDRSFDDNPRIFVRLDHTW